MEFTPSVLLSFLHTNFRFVKLNLLFPAIIMMILSLLCHKNVHFGFKWSPKFWPEAKLFRSKQSQLHKSHFQNNWRKIPTKTFNVGQLVHLFTHHCCKILRCCWESFVRKKLGRCPNFLGFLFSENCFWNLPGIAAWGDRSGGRVPAEVGKWITAANWRMQTSTDPGQPPTWQKLQCKKMTWIMRRYLDSNWGHKVGFCNI